jgi:beta propeller repeat protein
MDYYPAIYEDKVAYTWTDRLGDHEVWMYYIASNLQSKIPKSNTSSNPEIFGTRIVWQDWSNGGTDIYWLL